MKQNDLTQRHCKPCEGGVPKLLLTEAETLIRNLPNWKLEGEKIGKVFGFKNFVEAMKFVNQVAGIAEVEGHHPDISIHYNKVTLTLWTHAIGGLSENDFIVAAKVDALTEK